MGRYGQLNDASDIPLGLTFDDVLLLPLESSVLPSKAETKTSSRAKSRSTSRFCHRRWIR